MDARLFVVGTNLGRRRIKRANQPVVEQLHRLLLECARAADEPVAVRAVHLDIEQADQTRVLRMFEMAGMHEGDAQPLRGGLQHQATRVEKVDRLGLDVGQPRRLAPGGEGIGHFAVQQRSHAVHLFGAEWGMGALDRPLRADDIVRGDIQSDGARLAGLPADPALFALFGQGYLAITFALAATGERYQGIVPLDGETLSAAAESYFIQSEQIPSLLRVGIAKGPDGRTVAGGLFLQHLPEGEEGRERLHVKLDHPEWEHVQALGQTMQVEELADAALPLETLVWRLFHEEQDVRVSESPAIVRGCRCSAEYIASVITKFSVEERREMADADGLIQVSSCAASSSVSVPKARSTISRRSGSVCSSTCRPISVMSSRLARRSAGSGTRRTSPSRSIVSIAWVTVRGAKLKHSAMSAARTGACLFMNISILARASDAPCAAMRRSSSR